MCTFESSKRSSVSSRNYPGACDLHAGTGQAVPGTKNTALAILLITLGTLCTGGCSNTELAGSWLSPKFDGPKYTSFVVMGVSRDSTLRRVAEDAFVTQLALRGINALPSYQILPPTDPEKLTREQIERAVRQQAVQGVIVARVSKVEKEARTGGGFGSGGGGFGGYAGHYQQSWSGSYVAGGTTYQYDVVTVNVELFDVKSGEMVWSGVTRTFDTSDLDSSTRYWAKVVIEALVKRGLI
jgi:hypothetical protein